MIPVSFPMAKSRHRIYAYLLHPVSNDSRPLRQSLTSPVR
jgi:hypothetical protein